MGIKIDEAIIRYKNNAEYERIHGSLQGCLEFRQLAKWLEELKAYHNMYHADNVDNCLREKVGMTIDDCISKLTEILEDATEDENSVCYVTVSDEPTLKKAIDTMCKYQKIEQIVADRKGKLILDTLVAIIKVVEDGNN